MQLHGNDASLVLAVSAPNPTVNEKTSPSKMLRGPLRKQRESREDSVRRNEPGQGRR